MSKDKNTIGSDYKFLAQGTLYPDVVESAGGKNNKGQVIKSHHNVGGLPKEMDFKLVEPLRDLFKDEVREVGTQLGITDNIISRHPFPGPGLAIRIIGEITKEKIEILQKADQIFIDELKCTLTDIEKAKQAKFQGTEFWNDILNSSIASKRTANIHALIFNDKGEIFVQHRCADKKIFPNIWEASVYGKCETGEDLKETLDREIFEETGWKVKKIVEYMGYTDWEIDQKMVTDNPNNYTPQRTFTFLVQVEGNLEKPKLESGKADAVQWINQNYGDLFVPNDLIGDAITTKMITKYFQNKMFYKSKKISLYDEVWQAFCVLTDVKSVGVMGDGRTYERLLGIRAVTAVDGMTADWARLPFDFLAKISNKLINEVRGINRVVYDISSKPPATIEWE
jgi:GMP synthase PP-ATPase subunit/8-oxo-dGTP pyrophosphatase MutT (NUDIX family)